MGARGAGRPFPLLALLAGGVASGVPAAYVLVSGGPLLVAALLPVLGLLPPALVLLGRVD